MSRRLALLLLFAGVGMTLAGCVERTIKITSNPPGARVFLNDEEIGTTPVKTTFLWYGDYDVILRKDGYKTLKTHHRVTPPWYEVPPLDFVSECLVAATIHDDHALPTYELTPTDTPDVDAIVERAVQLRGRALYEGF